MSKLLLSNANNNVLAIFVAYTRRNVIIIRRRLIKQPANVCGTLLTVIELSEIRRLRFVLSSKKKKNGKSLGIFRKKKGKTNLLTGRIRLRCWSRIGVLFICFSLGISQGSLKRLQAAATTVLSNVFVQVNRSENFRGAITRTVTAVFAEIISEFLLFEIFLFGRTIYCFHNDVYFHYSRFSFCYSRYAYNKNVNGIRFCALPRCYLTNVQQYAIFPKRHSVTRRNNEYFPNAQNVFFPVTIEGGKSLGKQTLLANQIFDFYTSVGSKKPICSWV